MIGAVVSAFVTGLVTGYFRGKVRGKRDAVRRIGAQIRNWSPPRP